MPKVEIHPDFAPKAKKLLKKHPDRQAKVRRALDRLAENPRHHGLATKKYDQQNGIWQSYAENKTPSAWRIWWQWDSTRPDTIIVISFGPHP